MRIEVKSEIAGQVWKQMANEGDTLAADDTIIILESMKMEIPITAPKSGKIEKLHVSEQDMVAEGQLIATLRTD